MIDQTHSSLPEIDYLSKDYASFRQLMLDHLAVRLPEWKEPSEADIGNVITEVLAYAADYLSYYQDAVATEAYLGTARRRPSIKRHVRMLDYILHEGCNARVWVHIAASEDTQLPQGTPLLTRISELAQVTIIAPGAPAYDDALEQQTAVFETLFDAQLFASQHEIAFFVEDGQESTLPAGCTRAVLCDPGSELKEGQVLLFEEVKGPMTGDEFDADPSHRHVVRLTGVSKKNTGSLPMLTIEWAVEDALPFPLTIATKHNGDYIAGISVARGNMVLADHGRTISYEPLPPVVSPTQYRPSLQTSDLTHAVQEARDNATSASLALYQDPRAALPAIMLFKQDAIGTIDVDEDAQVNLSRGVLPDTVKQTLYSTKGIIFSDNVVVIPIYGTGWELRDRDRKLHVLLLIGEQGSESATQLTVNILKPWTLLRDLLSSVPLVNSYCVDMEDDGRAFLHFGTEASGSVPAADATFVVTYRTGRGTKGNVRAETIAHIVTDNDSIVQVRNPLPAQGGTNPELIEDARMYAPFEFQAQQRCITEEDYAEIVCRHPHVANAIAQLRWTGSWQCMFVYVQPVVGQNVDAAFRQELLHYLEDFRCADSDIELCAPLYVALMIALRIHLKPGLVANIVHSALMQAFSTAEGSFFSPTNFTFGQAIYPSQIITTAMNVHGVDTVEIVQFQRLDSIMSGKRQVEHITIHPLEVVRLDNDAHAPQHGIIQFYLEGGL